MELDGRIEGAIESALEHAGLEEAPPRLRAAVRDAVFPGGGRIRPRLCLEVARACGDPDPGLSDAAAAAIEMIHCASLVHDDLPCFDAADTRRGLPAVHRRHGEDMAVLAGDSLIVEAFACLGAAAGKHPDKHAPLVQTLARASGMAAGISAGQAWETEPGVEIERVHRAKTASLFEAACVLGAVSAGQDGDPWRDCGRLFGEAYQIADDIADATGTREKLGKPVGQDAHLARPSMVQRHGLDAATRRLDERIQAAVEAIPACPGRGHLADTLAVWARRLAPRPTDPPGSAKKT